MVGTLKGHLPGHIFTPGMMRGVKVGARDSRTLELLQFYPLPEHQKDPARYRLDLYFFFPRSFGIGPASFKPAQFYAEAKSALRLQAPSLDLAALQDPEHPQNPGAILRRRLDAAAQSGEDHDGGLVALAQMYGAEAVDAVKTQGKRLRKRIKRARGAAAFDGIDATLRGLCDDAEGLLIALESLSARAKALRGALEPGLVASLTIAEEYVSATLDEEFSKLGLRLTQATHLRDGSARAMSMRLRVAHTLERVAAARRRRGFTRPKGDNAEYYTYRMSLLKKELQRALYVDTRAGKADPFYANSAAMVAAALAAVWATIAQVPLIAGSWRTPEGMLLMAGAVGAYVLKDRIKDLVKQRLIRRWVSWDHDLRIDGDALDPLGLGSFSGHARERTRWLEEPDLPDDIRALRQSQRTVNGATTDLERVLHYHRDIDLQASGDQPLPEGYGVQEIFRLPLDNLIRRLDEPTDEVSWYEPNVAAFRCREMPRVYHLNLVAVTTDLTQAQQYVHRTRVVVNQDRILRLEPVLDRNADPLAA